MNSQLEQLASLGPALGAVAVIGMICWKLLIIMEKQSKAMEEISKNMQAQTDCTKMHTKHLENVLEQNRLILNLLLNKKA